jgi:hypothetical protein
VRVKINVRQMFTPIPRRISLFKIRNMWGAGGGISLTLYSLSLLKMLGSYESSVRVKDISEVV